MRTISIHYPYGMLMPERIFSSPDYRYGFNGQEKDDELNGEGNIENYKYRIYDPRICRFLSCDPLTRNFTRNSPYAFCENRVIDGIELEGLERMPLEVHTVLYGGSGYVSYFFDWLTSDNDQNKSATVAQHMPVVSTVISTKQNVEDRVRMEADHTMNGGFKMGQAVANGEDPNKVEQKFQQDKMLNNVKLMVNAVEFASIATVGADAALASFCISGTGQKILSTSIRFSQSTVNDYQAALNSFKTSYDPIDIVKMQDGIYTAIDNTRLLAARNTNNKAIKVATHAYNEPLPGSMLDRFENPFNKGVGDYAKTWGQAVEYRTYGQTAAFRKSYGGLGTFVKPKIGTTGAVKTGTQ